MSNLAQFPQHEQSATVMTIADNVRAEVARWKLTDAEFAADMRITAMSMSRRLSGQTPFTTSEVDRIAAYFKIPVGDFFVARTLPEDRPTPPELRTTDYHAVVTDLGAHRAKRLSA